MERSHGDTGPAGNGGGALRRGSKRLLGFSMLILGGIVTVATLAYLACNLVDRVIFLVGIPGIVCGLALIWAGSRLTRVNEK